MDVFCSKSNTTLCQIDYFSQKKLKFQMTNSGQNEKIDVSKSFIFRIYNTGRPARGASAARCGTAGEFF